MLVVTESSLKMNLKKEKKMKSRVKMVHNTKMNSVFNLTMEMNRILICNNNTLKKS